jgi:curli biogenesis system outer membrane secretion channel CsgG
MLNRSIRALVLAGISTATLMGCATSSVSNAGNYATPVLRAPVTSNPTPYSSALVCLSTYARANGLVSPRIAIGRIDDLTGKAEADGTGRQMTMGASLMAMSAFGKAGANLVERFDTGISENEMKYSNNKLIGDAPGAPGQANDYRRIYAGSVVGSDFYVVGGITELNANIYSTGGDFQAGQVRSTGARARIGARTYVMNIAMDFRVVDTISQQVVDILSYQKQIIANEVGAGVFDILGGNLFDLSAGKSTLEPKQLAVRAIVERATVEIMANFYGMPGPQACMQSDPFGIARTSGVTGSFVPAYNNLGTNNAQSREDPYRWNTDRDADVPTVRGRRY